MLKSLTKILIIAAVLTALVLGLFAYRAATEDSTTRWLKQQREQTKITNQIARAEAWGQIGVILIYVAGGTLSLSMIGGAGAVLLYARRRAGTFYAHDGDYGIQVVRRTLFERMIYGGDQVTVIQPNHQLAPAAVHTLSRAGDLHTAAGLDVADLDRLQRRADQHARTLQTQAASAGGGPKWAAAAKLLAGAYDRPDRMGKGDEAEDLPMLPAAAPLSLAEAVRQSESGQIVLGQSKKTGDLAIWDSDSARQIAIFGANGTGKTASAASTAVISLIRAGYHTIILDPKGGADWRSFERWTERHDSDAERMGQQLAAVVAEMERRGRLCEEYEVANVDALPAHVRPPAWALVVEELGDTRIEAKALGILDDIDTPLDRLMALSRYTGLRIVLIDQRPQEWPKRVKANTKELLTFRQGMDQGNAVGYYHAHRLANRGEFAMSGERYQAFHALPQVHTLLADVPALTAARIVPPVGRVRGFGGSERGRRGVSMGQETPPSPRTTEPNEPAEPAPVEPEETEIQQAARAWIASNPDGAQIAMREALAPYNAGKPVSKGYASELWHKCHPNGDHYTPGPVVATGRTEEAAQPAGLDWEAMDKATLLDLMEQGDGESSIAALREIERRGVRWNA